MKRTFFLVCGVVLVAATVFGNREELECLCSIAARHVPPTREKAFRESSRDSAFQTRSLVSRVVPPGEKVWFVTEEEKYFSSGERDLRNGLAFDRLPDSVRSGPSPDPEDAEIFVVPNGRRAEFRAAGPYRRLGATATATLFAGPRHRSAPVRPSGGNGNVEWPGMVATALVAAFVLSIRGFSNLLVFVYAVSLVSVLIATCGFPVRMPAALAAFGLSAGFALSVPRIGSPKNDVPNRRSFIRFGVFCAVLFCAVALPLSLSRIAETPGAVGSVGGRAKQWFWGVSLAKSFETPGREFFLPGYAPGLPGVVSAMSGLSGGAGDWLFQFLPTIAMAALLFLLASSARTPFWRCACAALFSTPLALQLASQCYAETFALLFLVAGIRLLEKDGTFLPGWILAGGAGWFKNEGLALYVLAGFLIVHRMGWRKTVIWKMVVGMAAPVLWIVAVRFAGGGIPDWAPFSSPLADNLSAAWKTFFPTVTERPWEFAFSFVFLVPAAVVSVRNRRIDDRLAILVSGIVFSVVLYAWSRASDIRWHVETSQPRLLWDFSVLALSFHLFRKTGTGDSSTVSNSSSVDGKTAAEPVGEPDCAEKLPPESR